MTEQQLPNIEVQSLVANHNATEEQFNPLKASPGYALHDVGDKCTLAIPEEIHVASARVAQESTDTDIDVICGLDSSSSPSPVPASREYSLTLHASLSEYSISRPAKTGPANRKSSTRLTQEPKADDVAVRNPKCQEELNWCSYEDLENHYELLSEETLGLLGILNQKRNYLNSTYPGFPHDKTNLYLRNMPPLVLSGSSKAGSIVYCCRRKRPCHSWMFCSTCSKYRANDGKKRFSSSFHKDTFLFLTCSFDADIPVSSTNNAIRAYWRAVEDCLYSMFDDGYINGAYIGHELKVRSFMPARVLPHSHALITTTDDDLEKLRILIHERLAADETIYLSPSIKIESIDPDDFDNRIAYITKSLDLKEPYDSAWEHHVTQTPKKAITLNIEMKNTIDALAAAALDFDRVVYIGNLRAQNRKSYIGDKAGRERKRKKPSKGRKKAKRRTKSRKAQKRTQKR